MEEMCLEQRYPYYPYVSVISAARILTIYRCEESVRPFVRLYSITIWSLPVFVVNADSTTCKKTSQKTSHCSLQLSNPQQLVVNPSQTNVCKAQMKLVKISKSTSTYMFGPSIVFWKDGNPHPK